MDQIKWCLNQKKGIELVEQSDNLREAYLIKAEESLEVLRTTKIRDWRITRLTIQFIIASILCL